MNIQKGLGGTGIIVILAIILGVGGLGYYALNKNDAGLDAMHGQDEEMMKEGGEMMGKTGDVLMQEGEKMMEGEEIIVGEMMVKYTGTVLAGKSALVIDFNKSDYDAARASDKLVVLYFYANWCPICKEEVANSFYPAFNELSSDDVIAFRVNFNDNETDGYEKALAKEFGVAYQHTKVFLKDGSRILKSPESWSKSRYNEEINQAI